MCGGEDPDHVLESNVTFLEGNTKQARFQRLTSFYGHTQAVLATQWVLLKDHGMNDLNGLFQHWFP